MDLDAREFDPRVSPVNTPEIVFSSAEDLPAGIRSIFGFCLNTN